MKQRIMKIFQTAFPLVIIATLLYVALFVQPTPSPTRVEVPPIEHRDRFYGVATPASSIIWAVACHGKIVRSEDSGQTWVVQETPTIAHLQSIATWDDQKAIAVGNAGIVLMTSDGGKNWKKVDVPKSKVGNKLLCARAYPGGIGWAVGEYGALLRTENYGKTWARARDPEDIGLNDIVFIGDKGWIAAEFSTILYTIDGGKTWEQAETDMMEETSLMSIAFRDEMNGLAVGLSGTVLASKDGGKTWVSSNPPTKEHLFDVIWDKNSSSWITVGDAGVMYKGDPSGVTWTGGRMDDLVLSWFVEVKRSGNRLYVAGDSFGYYENEKLTLYN